jgi:hypothetical protein
MIKDKQSNYTKYLARASRAHPTWSRKAIQVDAQARAEQAKLTNAPRGGLKFKPKRITTLAARRDTRDRVLDKIQLSRSIPRGISTRTPNILLTGGADRALASHQQHSLAPSVRGGTSGVLYESRTVKLRTIDTFAPGNSVLINPGQFADSTSPIGQDAYFTNLWYGPTVTLDAVLAADTDPQLAPSTTGLSLAARAVAPSGGKYTQLLATSVDVSLALPFGGSAAVSAISPGEGGRYLGGRAPVHAKTVITGGATPDLDAPDPLANSELRYDLSQHYTSMLDNSVKLCTGGNDTARTNIRAVGTTFDCGLANRYTAATDEWDLYGLKSNGVIYGAVAAGLPLVRVDNTSSVELMQVMYTVTYTWAVATDPGSVEPLVKYGVTEGGFARRLGTEGFRSFIDHGVAGAPLMDHNSTSTDMQAGPLPPASNSLITIPRVLRSPDGHQPLTVQPSQVSAGFARTLLDVGPQLINNGEVLSESLGPAIASKNPLAIASAVLTHGDKIIDTAQTFKKLNSAGPNFNFGGQNYGAVDMFSPSMPLKATASVLNALHIPGANLVGDIANTLNPLNWF